MVGSSKKISNGSFTRGRGYGKTLLLPPRQLLHLSLGAILQIHLAQQLHGVNRPAVEFSQQQQQLPQIEFLEKGSRLELNANPLLNLPRVAADVQPIQNDRPGIDGPQRFDHFQSGGLSCTVGAEDAEDFLAADRKADPIDGDQVSISLAQVVDSQNYR